MFVLCYMNVVKIVDTESKRDQLLAKGFTLAAPAVETVEEETVAPTMGKTYEEMTREELFDACEAAGINVPRNTKTETLIARLSGKGEEGDD